MTFRSMQDAISKGTLNAVVNRLMKCVSDKVLGKRKLEDFDSIAVNNNVKLFSIMFQKLRRRE